MSLLLFYQKFVKKKHLVFNFRPSNILLKMLLIFIHSLDDYGLKHYCLCLKSGMFVGMVKCFVIFAGTQHQVSLLITPAVPMSTEV